MIHKCDCRRKKYSCHHCRGKVRESLERLGVDVWAIQPSHCPSGYPAVYFQGKPFRSYWTLRDAIDAAEWFSLHWVPSFGKVLGVGIVGQPDTYRLVLPPRERAA